MAISSILRQISSWFNTNFMLVNLVSIKKKKIQKGGKVSHLPGSATGIRKNAPLEKLKIPRKGDFLRFDPVPMVTPSFIPPYTTVYRIRCNDCNGTYIGETGRRLTTRLGEHQTATDKEDLTNNITQHHRKTGHDINWDSSTCLTHSTDKDQRLTLESWFTNLQPNPLNRSRKLPAAYERLSQSEYRTADENADFDKYVTAAYYFTRTITVTNLLTPTITNKTK